MTARVMVLALAALGVTSACTRPRPASGDSSPAVVTPAATTPAATTPAPSSAPTITSLTPDSANVSRGEVTEMLVRGNGFEPGAQGQNTVEIGPVTLNAVPANAAGTELRVMVPQTYRLRGGAPPQRMMPGEYTVVVRTSRGASNALKLRVQ